MEMLDAVANPFPNSPKGIVIVTFTDYTPDAVGRANPGANIDTGGATDGATAATILTSWARSVHALGLKCMVMVCGATATTEFTVAPLSQACTVAHAPACAVNPRLARWFYVRDFLHAGYDVLNSDPDVAFLRNPVPHLARLVRAHPEADVFTSSDSNTGVYVYGSPVRSGGAEVTTDGTRSRAVLRAPGERGPLSPTRWEAAFPGVKIKQGFAYKPEHAWRDDFALPELLGVLKTGDAELGLDEPGNCWPHQYNTGLMVWRSTDRAKALMARWLARLDALRGRPVADDQLPLNEITKNGSSHCAMTGGEFIEATKGTCGDDQLLNSVAGGTACLGILALAQFGNGFTYCTARDFEQYYVKPYAFHATYANNKLMKMREESVLFDDTAYYEGRFLVYDPVLPVPFFAPGKWARGLVGVFPPVLPPVTDPRGVWGALPRRRRFTRPTRWFLHMGKALVLCPEAALSV
jgi:hypothetical protein